MSWTISGAADRSPEGAARPLPDGGRRRAPLRARLACARTCRALPGDAGAVIGRRRVRGADLRLVPRGAARPADPRRDDHARAGGRPSRCTARCSTVAPGRCCGCQPPELEADFYRHARDQQLDGVRAVRAGRGGGGRSRVLRIGRRPTPTRWPASTRHCPRGSPARAAAAARRGRASAGRLTIWPTPALAQQAAHGGARLRRVRARAPCSSTSRTRSPPGGAAASARPRDRAARDRPRGPDRGRPAPTCGSTSRGGRWINSDGRRNMPSGEVFTGPHERSANGTIRFDVPSTTSGPDVAGVELTFRDGEVVAARADLGDAQLQAALATDAGRALPRGARDRHQHGHRSRHRLDAARREDRRHDSPRARSLVSRRPGARTSRRCTGI